MTASQPLVLGNSNSSSGISLKKGQKVSLGNSLTKIKAGIYWQSQHDLDVSCFLLGTNSKVLGDDWFVFYGALRSPDGAVIHSGDARDGSMPDDDEIITVSLTTLNPDVQKLVFVVTINEAKQLGLNFANVTDAGIHINDAITGQELCRFQLTDYYNNVTSMVVGELYRYNNEWKFNPIGDGLSADLYDLCMRYGVNVRE